MKSPFPGVDPFIEGYNWQSFHVLMIVYLHEYIHENLPDNYTVDAENSLYVVSLDDEPTEKNYRPDLTVEKYADQLVDVKENVAVLTPPTSVREQERVNIRRLAIRRKGDETLVTAIELLSPANKSGKGLVKYREKRDVYQISDVSLVEIDLLRGGTRPDTMTNCDTTYLIQIVNDHHEKISEWWVPLLTRLPVIPIPLMEPDPTIALPLQEIFNKTYRMSSFPKKLVYDLERLNPPLQSEADRRAVVAILEEAIPSE